MSLQERLNKIDQEITTGLKLKAADRLRNLINEHPNDLTIWNKLAELYYESGFLDAAGRYWILFEPNNKKKQKSIEAYKSTVNNSGYQILRDISFRGEKKALPEYAQKKMSELEKDSKEKVNFIPTYNKQKKAGEKKSKYNDTLKDKIVNKLIIGLLITIPILAIIGLFKVIEWIF